MWMHIDNNGTRKAIVDAHFNTVFLIFVLFQPNGNVDYDEEITTLQLTSR